MKHNRVDDMIRKIRGSGLKITKNKLKDICLEYALARDPYAYIRAKLLEEAGGCVKDMRGGGGD